MLSKVNVRTCASSSRSSAERDGGSPRHADAARYASRSSRSICQRMLAVIATASLRSVEAGDRPRFGRSASRLGGAVRRSPFADVGVRSGEYQKTPAFGSRSTGGRGRLTGVVLPSHSDTTVVSIVRRVEVRAPIAGIPPLLGVVADRAFGRDRRRLSGLASNVSRGSGRQSARRRGWAEVATVLTPRADVAWQVRAGSLEWSCWTHGDVG